MNLKHGAKNKLYTISYNDDWRWIPPRSVCEQEQQNGTVLVIFAQQEKKKFSIILTAQVAPGIIEQFEKGEGWGNGVFSLAHHHLQKIREIETEIF